MSLHDRNMMVSGLPNPPKDNNGKKYDQGKSPVWRGLLKYFPRALQAVADVSACGQAKYREWGSWRQVPDAFSRYSDALGRHELAEARGEMTDEECSKLVGKAVFHAAQTAWNALARLELLLSSDTQGRS